MRNLTLPIFLYIITVGRICAQDSTQLAVDSVVNTYELSEIVVASQKPLVKVDVDKITYSVAEDPNAKTDNVLDMLKKMPLVTVDGNNKISLKGSANFKVYMNGKPSGMFANNPEEVLKNMPANTVKSVEIITDPGAKYDAEGVEGIINIIPVSQASINGFTTTINGGLNSNKGGNAGLYVMAKQGKVGFVANLNAYKSNSPESDINKMQQSYFDNSLIYENADYVTKNFGLWGSGELSFEIDTLNLVNIGYNTYYGRGNALWEGVIERRGDLSYLVHREEDQNNSWGGTDVNVDYQHTAAKVPGRLLTLSYRYSYSPSDFDSKNIWYNPSPIENLPPEILLDTTKQYTQAHTDEHTFQFDYTTPFGKIHTLEVGTKYILRINKSNSDYLLQTDEGWQSLYAVDDERLDFTQFKHQNDIVSVYGSHALKLNKWGLKTGLRYEYTFLDVSFRNDNRNFETQYDNLVPSITTSYKINDAQNIRLAYNMRLNRPSIWQLNPFVDNSNPNFISRGNPKLDAVQTHTVSFNYGFFNSKFNLNANLSQDFTNNNIEQITQVDEANIGTTTYKNIGEKKSTNLMLYFNWTPIQGFKFYSNLGGSYLDIRANDRSLSNRYSFRGWGFLSAEYKLPWNVWLMGRLGGSSPWVNLQTTQSSYFWHQFNLRKDFMKDRMNVKIYASNPFLKNYHFKSTIDNPIFYQELNNIMSPREFGFVVSYRFGELKTQLKKTTKSIVNDDLIQGETGGAK